jgi:hypothetical protein
MYKPDAVHLQERVNNNTVGSFLLFYPGFQEYVSKEKPQIAEHQDKIKNPEKYIPNFKSLDPRQQHALINKKWPSDIKRQMEQKQILEGILKSKLK